MMDLDGVSEQGKAFLATIKDAKCLSCQGALFTEDTSITEGGDTAVRHKHLVLCQHCGEMLEFKEGTCTILPASTYLRLAPKFRNELEVFFRLVRAHVKLRETENN